jgi:hypothetical protein
MGGRLFADTVTVQNNSRLLSNSADIRNSFRINTNGIAQSAGDVTVRGSGSRWTTNSMRINSPGTMSADNYTQGADSIFLVELAGYGQGASDGYDWLDVTGTASLDGILELDLLSGFAPVVGDSFDILTASIISGMFDTTIFPTLAGIEWQLQTLIDFQGNTDVLRLSAVATVPVPAAAWLFGSALMGLGLMRRRKA